MVLPDAICAPPCDEGSEVEGAGCAPGAVDDIAKALRSGAITSRDLVEQSLEHAKRLNPVLNCFVSLDEEGARAAARTLDDELKAGVDRGALHGIPVAVKDIIDVAGSVTTSGSALFQSRVASADAQCVARLRAKGGIVVGKTVLHEFAYGITGDRSVHGASRNPYDPSRITGGSSGGSAAAVAAGIVRLALGTDTAGSVRVPAALCGVVGFKPAREAIPLDGVHPLAPSLDHVGVFARSAAEAQRVYEILVDESPRSGSDTGQTRSAWLAPSAFGPIEPAIENRILQVLSLCGFHPEVVVIEEAPALFGMLTSIQSREAYLAHADDLKSGSDRIDDEVLRRLEAGSRVSISEYCEAERERAAFQARITALFQRFDVLTMPTVPMVAPPIGERAPQINGQTVEVRRALLSLTSPWNLAGAPAISIPAGALGGLPFGLQLISTQGNERRLFDIARRVESRLI
jgi:aspartyl-tRNA(Asn)/glutamyl-tRNA(Gln) amidotransferase subunit A